jgi:PAS domain-containing protein
VEISYFYMDMGAGVVESQQIIDHLPVVVFEYTFFGDGRRDFTYLSPRSEELLGVDPRVLLRGTLSMESFIHPDDWPAFQLNLATSTERMAEFRWRGRCKGKRG